MDRKPVPVRQPSEEIKPRSKRPLPVDQCRDIDLTFEHEDRGDAVSSTVKDEKLTEGLAVETEIAVLEVSRLSVASS